LKRNIREKETVKRILCILLSLMLAIVTLPPPAWAAPAPAIESYLISGKLAEGEAAMLARLSQKPEDDQARFSLGTVQLLSGVERLMQSLYRYGLRSNGLTQSLPFLRLPVPENPNPETIRYEDSRQLFQTFLDDLAKVRATLEPIQDPAVKLPLRLGLVRLDFNGDGKAEPTESIWRVFEVVTGIRATEQQAKQFAIAFDAGDVLWLRGYCHLLAAIAEFGLAHNGQDFFHSLAHVAFAKPDTPYTFLVNTRPGSASFGQVDFVDVIALFHLLNFEVQEPQRMTTALQHLQSTLALSRQSWQVIMSEKDNDREWLPNARQKGVLPRVSVTQPMIDGWFTFLDEAESLLAGKKLIPFWRTREIRGVNLNKVFTEPRRLDVALWLQGTSAAPYLELGSVTNQQVWSDLARIFQGRFFGFAVWFN
jgi:hypothetical protein